MSNANTTIFTVAGNSNPIQTITLERDGVAIDLTGSTVDMTISKAKTRVQSNTGHTACTVVTAASGIISYQPEVGDFPIDGRYLGQIKISYSGVRVEYLPELIQFIAEIQRP